MGFRQVLGICSLLYFTACGANESERVFPIPDLNGDGRHETVLVREKQGSRIIAGEHYDDPTQSVHIAYSNKGGFYQSSQELARFSGNFRVINVRLNDYYGTGQQDLVLMRKDPLNNILTTILKNDGKGRIQPL